MPETLEPPVIDDPSEAEAAVPSDAELAYRAGVHRARERAYQDWAAEFDVRVRSLMNGGLDREQAGQQVMQEMEEYRRQLRDELADALLCEEGQASSGE